MTELIIPSTSLTLPTVSPDRLGGVAFEDPFGMQTVRVEDVDDHRIYHYAQRTGDITNANEKLRAEHVENRESAFRPRAQVPMVVWNLWESLGITMDEKELRKALMRHKDEFMTADVSL